jgi:predicted component of type VI protein secretion system
VIEVTGRVLLGRDPADAKGDAVLVAVDDPERSLSKTHASLRRAGDALVIEDLDSTNGVSVTRAGREVAVEPRTPYQLQDGDEVYLGQLRGVVSGGGGAA